MEVYLCSRLLRLGAQIRHSPARNGVNGARRLAAQTAAANGWYYMDWLANDDNPEPPFPIFL